jgi:hypothetical protein
MITTETALVQPYTETNPRLLDRRTATNVYNDSLRIDNYTSALQSAEPSR